MLVKLLKHDFKSTGKIMIPIVFVLFASTLLGAFLLHMKFMQYDAFLPIAIVLLITYILILISLSILTSLYLIIHFYRNLFSNQGYLTFTLPASPWTIFHSKLIMGLVWTMLVSVLIFGSALILIGAACGFQNLPETISELLLDELTANMEINGLKLAFQDIFGYTLNQLILLLIVTTIAASIYNVISGYGCVAIGQLYAKHKVIGSILAYIGICLLSQVLMFVVGFLLCFHAIRDMLSNPSQEAFTEQAFTGLMQAIYRPMFPAIIMVYLVLSIIFYIIIGIILNKKVNLD